MTEALGETVLAFVVVMSSTRGNFGVRWNVVVERAKLGVQDQLEGQHDQDRRRGRDGADPTLLQTDGEDHNQRAQDGGHEHPVDHRAPQSAAALDLGHVDELGALESWSDLRDAPRGGTCKPWRR